MALVHRNERGQQQQQPPYDPIDVNWQQFHQFLLQRMAQKTAGDTLRYAKRFANILLTTNEGDASILLQFTPDKRIHVMRALSSLSKFQGRYDHFLKIRQRYNLKWNNENEKLYAFERFFDDGKTLDKMLQWLREAVRELPKPYGDFFLFCTLTGLRALECINCIQLIKDPEKFKVYYNPERQCLEHFRFPALFIRRTKAAYISVVDKQILGIAQSIEKKILLYNTLKQQCWYNSLSMRLKYCRKLHGSWLRHCGIESEAVDLLQGRVPRTVFARHYLTPSDNLKDRVLDALEQLKKQVID